MQTKLLLKANSVLLRIRSMPKMAEAAFRNEYKISLILAIGYARLLASFSEWLLEKVRIGVHRGPYKPSLVCISHLLSNR